MTLGLNRICSNTVTIDIFIARVGLIIIIYHESVSWSSKRRNVVLLRQDPKSERIQAWIQRMGVSKWHAHLQSLIPLLWAQVETSASEAIICKQTNESLP